MKKIVCFLLSCILITACSDDKDIPQIPMDGLNDGFRQYLLENFDRNSDGSISIEEAALVTKIDINSISMGSLNGIEYLPNLEVLYCRFASLRSINVDNNPKLRVLDCSFNNIQDLDVSNCHALDTLICENHYYGTLVSFKINPELRVLSINGHGMAILDFSGNQHLKELSCSGDKLVHLDISNSAIEVLNCEKFSKLASIGFEGCTKLKK